MEGVVHSELTVVTKVLQHFECCLSQLTW